MKGLINEIQLKKDILDKFVKKFIKSDYTFRNPIDGSRELLWCYYRNDSKIYSTEELFRSPLQINGSIYFYDERTEEMYLTDFEDIRNFINGFEPWDYVDAEIFDDSLEWVISVTHEDISKVFGLDIMIEEYDYDKDMAQDSNENF